MQFLRSIEPRFAHHFFILKQCKGLANFAIEADPRSAELWMPSPRPAVPIALHFAALNSSGTSMTGVEGVANKTIQMRP